jgi:hypothetical protein
MYPDEHLCKPVFHAKDLDCAVQNLSCISPHGLATCTYFTVSARQIHVQPPLSSIFCVVHNKGILATRVSVEQVYFMY